MTLADGVSNRWWVNEEVKNRSLGKKKNGGLALKELPRQASPPPDFPSTLQLLNHHFCPPSLLPFIYLIFPPPLFGIMLFALFI